MPSVALQSVCVFCGSSTGTDPAIVDATVALGKLLAEHDIELVYGAGAVGLMGVIADTMLDAGGSVTGVIPTNLFSKEVGHTGLTRLEEVGSMHERKALMYELSDAFIALPGGFGTLEELAETLTWNQIGLIAKPVGVLNVNGFWDPLISQLEAMSNATLLKDKNRRLLVNDNDPVRLLERLSEPTPAYEPKWIDPT